MKRRSKKIVYLILSCLIIVNIFSVLTLTATQINLSVNNQASTIWRQAAQIWINDNGDFVIHASSGSGNITHPWIIENKVFNLTGQGKHGIHIEDTSAYFIVQNCIIFGAIGDNYGIFLDNVDNGQLINNTCSSNRVGIELRGSWNINLTDNICNMNQYYGFRLWNYLSGSNQWIRFVNNTANGQISYDGIRIEASDYCTLINNTFNDNEGQGLWLDTSNHNTLIGNNAHGNGNSGILMKPSSYNTIILNNATGNDYHGIRVESSVNNTLYNNTATNNWWNGLHLYNSDYCNLTANTANDNTGDGIGLAYYSQHNLVTLNILEGNGGQCISESSTCSDNTIQDNICVDGGNGGDGIPGFPWFIVIQSLVLGIFIYTEIRREDII